MKLFNTLTQSFETFKPRGEEANIYVCGITPYDTTHLGHAFTYTSVDILIRYLESKGLSVLYAQNVTDIDDDILRKAGEVGEDWQALGNRWTAHYIQDMKALNVRPPDYFPRATDVIPDIIQVVQELLSKGVAYEAGGSVYFNVDAWVEFGKLCRLPREQMLPIANERGNNPDDPNKRDPLDFVLWQARAPGEPAWDSPWGAGRPGWHIECSTMATRFLGEMVDIHSGGEDLCFPHHECEIAQMEPVTGKKPFVRTWMHIAMVQHEGEKMSKSLGNLVMVRDLLETWSPDAVRLYLGSHHYRDSWNHCQEELAQADQVARLVRGAATVKYSGVDLLEASKSLEAFDSALEDDLNTPEAINILHDLAKNILEAAKSGRNVQEAQSILRKMSKVFGLRFEKDMLEDRVLSGWNAHLKRFLPIEQVRS